MAVENVDLRQSPGGIAERSPALTRWLEDLESRAAELIDRHPEDRDWEKLLGGRTADLLVSHDQPRWRYRIRQGAPAFRQMQHGILEACVIHTHHLEEFSPVRSSNEEQRQAWLKRAEQLGTQV